MNSWTGWRLKMLLLILLAGCVATHAASVFISEFMALNTNTLQDEDGEYADWIELYNGGATAIDLEGWHLTDAAANPAQWTFPATNLPPGSYLLVFASGKNRAAAGAQLHTNFKLSGLGEYLGLILTDGVTAVSEFAPQFPPQTADISYGIPAGVVTNSLIATGVFCRALVPVDDALGQDWTSNTFNDSGWQSGTTGVGYERGTGYAARIGLDVGSPMYASNATCYIRVPFLLANAAQISGLMLTMTYDDGYVPYLNMRKGPGANNPEGLSWNTAASTASAEPGTQTDDLSDLCAALVDGTNMLAIHGLNQTNDSSDFLIIPQLDALCNLFNPATAPVQLAVPTPGSINGGAYMLTVAKVKFSHARGFHEAPFAVTLSCATAGATIRYRTDFIEPAQNAGIVYTGPVWISQTTCLRANAYTNGYLSPVSSTRTFIFVAQVVTQAANQTAAGFPSTWVRSDGVSVAADYAMDQRIVGPSDNYGGVYRASITNDLRSIPVMSIVTSISNLFDRYVGIYANPGGLGDNWERPASVEYFNDPRDTNGMQINCGLRIHGEANRGTANRKHSLRLLFKAAYGDARLDYPLFAGDPVEHYNTLVLRCMYGDSWMNRFAASYLREQWAHDTQRAMGHVGLHGRIVHLYVNGLYWGLYDAVERPDDAFKADHVAGPRENWDILQGLITAAEVELAEGSRLAYDAMLALVPKTPTNTVTDAVYAQLEHYLDLPLYADYMLLEFYSQNFDWPLKNWRIACQRNLTNPAGAPVIKFQYTVWDHESTLGFYGQDRTGIGNTLSERVGPAQIYYRIRGHRFFRRLFADRAQRLLFNGGALTVVSNLARWVALMQDVKGAIVGESARWGDVLYPNSPFTRDKFPFNGTTNWYTEMADKTNNWFPLRNGVLLTSLRNAGLYPSINAPAFSQFGGGITNGFRLAISASAGTIYYTTDGGDPANLDDTVAGTAFAYSSPVPLTDNVRVKARAKSGSIWSALTEAVFLVGPPPIRISEIMYNPANPPAGSTNTADDFEFIELHNTAWSPVTFAPVAFIDGIAFNFSNRVVVCPPRQCVLLVKNLAAFATRYNTNAIIIAGEYAGSLANAGEQIVLADALYGPVHQFAYSDAWYPSTDGGGYSLTIVNPYGALSAWNEPGGWMPSESYNGTPGYIVPEPGVALVLAAIAAALAGRGTRA